MPDRPADTSAGLHRVGFRCDEVIQEARQVGRPPSARYLSTMDSSTWLRPIVRRLYRRPARRGRWDQVRTRTGGASDDRREWYATDVIQPA
jgi:hypothetical protein